MGKVRTYDPKQVFVSFGTHSVTGYADGTFVKVETSGDGTTKTVGADGEVVRSLSPDGTYKVTATVMQTSPSVKWAQKQYAMDKKTGDGMFAVGVKDMRGKELFSAEQGWVTNAPSREYGKEAGTCEIVVDCGDGLVGEA